MARKKKKEKCSKSRFKMNWGESFFSGRFLSLLPTFFVLFLSRPFSPPSVSQLRELPFNEYQRESLASIHNPHVSVFTRGAWGKGRKKELTYNTSTESWTGHQGRADIFLGHTVSFYLIRGERNGRRSASEAKESHEKEDEARPCSGNMILSHSRLQCVTPAS